MFFVCGAPKSGTTWLQRSLNSHPSIICKGEGHFIEKLLLPMATVFRDYNTRLKLVSKEVYNGNPYYNNISNSDFFEFCHQVIMKMMLSNEEKSADAFGDKTPRYYEYIDNIKHIYPNGKIICILRDPRDLVVSKLYHAKRSGVKDVLNKGSENRIFQIKLTINQFVNCFEKITSAINKYTSDVYVTYYEELLGNNAEEIKKILEFIGVHTSKEIINDIVYSNSFQSFTNRNPGEMDINSFYRKGISGDWVNEITDEEERMIREYITSRIDISYFQ
nr:sulfotransferase [Shinella sp. JR1-6]